MPVLYTIQTDDTNLYQRMFHMTLDPANHGPNPGPVAPPPAAAAAPAPLPVPAAVTPPPPAAVAPPPAAVAPPPVTAPAPAAHGPAPAGWTVQHVTSALQALGSNSAKGGPAAVKTILAEFGATKISDLDPARWPEVYARATAA